MFLSYRLSLQQIARLNDARAFCSGDVGCAVQSQMTPETDRTYIICISSEILNASDFHSDVKFSVVQEHVCSYAKMHNSSSPCLGLETKC